MTDNQRFEATIADWVDHITTLFPQVRLKQYLEVRSMDACSWSLDMFSCSLLDRNSL